MFSVLRLICGLASCAIKSPGPPTEHAIVGLRMNRMWLKVFAIAVVMAGSGHVAATAQESSFDVWRNPKNSVHIRAERCGDRMCGVVVWASEKAKADARKGSQNPLVGSQLFRDFVEERPGVWRGQVFVPDIGRTFTGTIRVVDANRLEAKGCLLGKLGCRSQQWYRVAESHSSR
ncbi:hypothetical protein WYH_00782 [Croceibacterium atlanticum]|jgi:uncharacterized protein (DUF2147 family)|uniref:DUF2147 domain-containing protein n=2 Tax=Sphingomonadales TaxID=204457 RepID=A0A0F7KRU2_9SPHN|nr:hypothetical protein WYH_00782 [Croceibacterium atlanticum]